MTVNNNVGGSLGAFGFAPVGSGWPVGGDRFPGLVIDGQTVAPSPQLQETRDFITAIRTYGEFIRNSAAEITARGQSVFNTFLGASANEATPAEVNGNYGNGNGYQNGNGYENGNGNGYQNGNGEQNGNGNGINIMVARFNGARQLAANHANGDNGTRTLLRQIDNLTYDYGAELSGVGVTRSDDGSLQIDAGRLNAAMESGEAEHLLSGERGFMRQLARLGESMAENPTQFISIQDRDLLQIAEQQPIGLNYAPPLAVDEYM